MKSQRRPQPRRARARGGFTLLELGVVLLLVAILAGLAQTQFRAQMQRSRRAEAVVGLEGVQRAQQAYHQSHGHYGDTFDEIGFTLEGGARIDPQTVEGRTYTFTLKAVPFEGDPRGNYRALATGDLDAGDGVLDILILENHLTVVREP